MPDNCNYDKEKFIEYFETVDLIVYSNSPRFLPDKYGDDRVKKESSFTTTIVDGKQSRYITAKI